MVKIEEELTDLAVMGVGAGLKGAIVGYVKDFLPDVTEQVAALIAGALMWYFGDRLHEYVKAAGAGILISAIGGIVEEKVPSLGGGGGGSPAPQTGQQAQSLDQLAAMEASMIG